MKRLIKSVNQMLVQDDIAGVVEHLDKQSTIDKIIVAYSKGDDDPEMYILTTGFASVPEAIGYLTVAATQLSTGMEGETI